VEIVMNIRNRLLQGVCASILALGFAACEKKGPVEQAGEEIDEAVDTVKNGGESVASKVDDAADDARKAVEDAGKDAKK
jgi:type II secretory pathway predicted ATPase ExeA